MTLTQAQMVRVMQSPVSTMTTSIWQATAKTPSYPKLNANETADVCIVGAGIAGLSAAYHLAREGKKVIVLDDGPVGDGETGRTTAHLVSAMDERIEWLEKVHGAEVTRLVVESHSAAINRIEQIVQLEGIDCDFERVDGYLMSRSADDREELEREAEAANRLGLSDIALVERAPIAAFETGTTLKFPNQGQFHILKYLSGIAKAITQKYGGSIYCNTHVKEVKGGAPCQIVTDEDKTVKSSSVLVCTNASISDYVRTHIKIEPNRTYVIAAAVPRGSVEKALFWNTGHPYNYVRIQALDAGEYDALIVGGEDHKVGHDHDPQERWNNLEIWMRDHWPQAGEVIYRWSGQVLEPADGLAYIGRNPDGAENVYMASGDSGQGMTHGTIAGILLTDLVLGRPNPWARVYDPKRVSLSPTPVAQVARQNFDVAVQYAKGYLAPGEVSSIEEVPVGEGRLMRRGASKIAVYRDKDGKVTQKSAACTHLKCIVEWNSMEKSWDCPCHGSRFSPTGEVLNGPAISALEDVEPVAARGVGRKRKAKA
jgi:glycine/D-amino acid oxidase-like deaminating enzyme/nitrite reductase/ring-hydroxylating ferredoxin subunit